MEECNLKPDLMLIGSNLSISMEKLVYDKNYRLPEYANPVKLLIRKWASGQKKFVLKTSGSTGTPKKIDKRRSEIIASSKVTAKKLGLEAGDTALLSLSVNQVAGFMMVMRAAVNNWNLYVTPPSKNPLNDIPADTHLSFAAFVPLQMDTILTNLNFNQRFLLEQMKAIIIGGAPVYKHLENKILKLKVPVYETYGMTETLSHVAFRKINGKNGPEAYFTPLPGVTLTTGKNGALKIQGFFNEYNHTIETNDIADLQSDGKFKLLGRLDNVINSGGHKVWPEKTESALSIAWEKSFPETPVPVFLVAGMPDEKLGSKVIAIVETEQLPVSFEEKLFRNLKHSIHPYEMPKKLYALKKFSYTRNGKIKRKGTVEKLLSLTSPSAKS